MRRVVITGIGIVSCLGNNKAEVLDSLKNGRSGIRFNEEYAELGMRSHVSGSVQLDTAELIDRKLFRFMGDCAAFAYIAMQEAIEDAGLTEEQISNLRTGIVAGSGGGSPQDQLESNDIAREKGVKRVGPYRVPRTMASSVSACLATAFKIKGINYSISSACATSAHCIGNAAELIQMEKQDLIFAGGSESEHWTLSHQFDAMGALSSRYNDTPGKASEVTGYGATSDGHDMVAPSGEGGARAMQIAVANLGGPVDYINAHGTSTPAGDITELNAIRSVFADNIPTINSTKSLSGHSLGAAGVHEATYSLLMMENDFIAASVNIENLDEGAEGFPIARERKDNLKLNRIMSNSFGFGGTNACLVFDRYQS